MQARIITPTCKFDCEMVVSLDAGLEHQEIRKIYDESIALRSMKQNLYVSISDFKNESGQSIGEYLLERHESFAVALSEKE